jgi:hypothetical protein
MFAITNNCNLRIFYYRIKIAETINAEESVVVVISATVPRVGPWSQYFESPVWTNVFRAHLFYPRILGNIPFKITYRQILTENADTYSENVIAAFYAKIADFFTENWYK